MSGDTDSSEVDGSSRDADSSDESECQSTGADNSGSDSTDDTRLEYAEEELNEILSSADEETLRLALSETRPTIDGIKDFVSDIDDKAGQTLRLNALIIGILLTIVSITFNQNPTVFSRFVNLAFGLGVVSTALSFYASLITYTRSEIIPGLTVDDIGTVLDNNLREKTMLLSLLLSHSEWIRKNSRVNRRDANTLYASHVLLWMSIGYYPLAIIFGVFEPSFRLRIEAVVAVTVILGLFIWIPRTEAWLRRFS